ncbi:hypothetical protein SRABI05_00634 [Agrobacterium fabrum]|uniref:hypothetical protein n=1 Tax=Agrobacterium fabrum TaxID=1176649 RepID=UPI001DDCB242|nr:hypothetical protein [Agrobacterium fabrum]CAH0154684.1 hypothetical protein SRABI05_00634 [Agrobacterium fabrum]CAH0174207.1 hypothetical protein SRABI46_01348 [Agrobacterium fabrum]
MKIDLSRLAVLRTISAREKAAVDMARGALDMELSASKEVRRKIAAEQRRDGDRASTRRHIDDLRAKEDEINQRVEDHHASIEVLQERATAAHRLRKACEAWVAENEQNGGAQ